MDSLAECIANPGATRGMSAIQRRRSLCRIRLVAFFLGLALSGSLHESRDRRMRGSSYETDLNQDRGARATCRPWVLCSTCATWPGLSYQTRSAGCGWTFSHLNRVHRRGAKRKFVYNSKTIRRPREWPASKGRRSEPTTSRVRYRYVHAKTLNGVRKLKFASGTGPMCNLGRAIGEWSIKQLFLTTSPSLRPPSSHAVPAFILITNTTSRDRYLGGYKVPDAHTRKKRCVA
jgi:hypothetical protein